MFYDVRYLRIYLDISRPDLSHRDLSNLKLLETVKIEILVIGRIAISLACNQILPCQNDSELTV